MQEALWEWEHSFWLEHNRHFLRAKGDFETKGEIFFIFFVSFFSRDPDRASHSRHKDNLDAASARIWALLSALSAGKQVADDSVQ